jgi:hypothetical protein
VSDPRRRSRWIDAALVAVLLAGFSVEAFGWGGTAWIAQWKVACSHRDRHHHGAGEFIGDGLDEIPVALALGELGALLAVVGVLAAFRVAAGRSPGEVVARTGSARPIARGRVLAPAVLATAAVGGAGTVLLHAYVSDFQLSFFVDGFLRSRASPRCVPDAIPATLGLHSAAFAAALVAGWATRVQRRWPWIVAIAILGAAAGASGAHSWSSAVRSPARAACVYFFGEEWGVRPGGPVREIWAWNRSGSTVLEALWLAGPDRAASGERLEWSEPLMFRSGSGLAFTSGSTRDVDSCMHHPTALLRRVREVDAVALVRDDGTRVPCLEAGTLFRRW